MISTDKTSPREYRNLRVRLTVVILKGKAGVQITLNFNLGVHSDIPTD